MRQNDTRLIQAAVIGGADSDQPVILPEQPHNLDEFLGRFGRHDFWCGTLLGGCGERLRPKRYVTKVCHFSHGPDSRRSECHRTTHSADSADHLFIKQHVSQWLAQQGHTAQAELRSLGHCHGDAVDFWLRRTQTHLRFELHPEDYRSWLKAANSLGAKKGHIEWVFAQDDALTRDRVARWGYALLVRCETEGNDRRVFLGTLTGKRAAVWAPLEKCRMTGSGLVTPALEELRAKGSVREAGTDHDPLPGSFPISGGQIAFAMDTDAAPLGSSPFAAPGRYVIPGFIKPAGSRIVRAHLSLPESVPTPTEEYVYRLAGAARLLITDAADAADALWAVRADKLVALKGLDAELTGLWRARVALDEKYVPVPSAEDACERSSASEHIAGRPETVRVKGTPERPATPPVRVAAAAAPKPDGRTAAEQMPSQADQRRAARRRTQIWERLEQAAATRDRTGGSRAQRLSQAIGRGETHLHQYEMVIRRSRALGGWLKVSVDVLDELDRLIGRPIAVTPPQAVASSKKASKPVAAEPKPAKKKDPHLRKIRRLLGELDRTHRTRPTRELLRLFDEIRQHRAQLPKPLSAVEAMHVERWRRVLEDRRSAERSAKAAAASRSTTPRAGRPAGPPQQDRISAETIERLAVTARALLEELARDGSTLLNWGDLRLRTGAPPLPPDDQRALLIAVDRGTSVDEPLLSTLVNSSDVAPHRLYRQVRSGLGRMPIPEAELAGHRAMEVLRLRQLWRYR